MARSVIEIGNSRSRIRGLRPKILKLLRYELSFQESEPGPRSFIQRDGSVKASQWDGWRRLLTEQGLMPSGLVPRTIRLLQKWGVGFEIQDRRVRPEERVPRWTMPSHIKLRDYQKEACDAAERLGRGVIDSPPRCISGDTRVQISRGGKTFWICMRDLVHRFNGGDHIRRGAGSAAWQPDIPVQIRSMDSEGFIRLFAISRAWESGDKELIRITLTTGFELAGSADHRVLTTDGWAPLGQLRIDSVLIAELPRGRSRLHGEVGGRNRASLRVGPVLIESIEAVGLGDTYDLEVPGAGNFLADRIVTHNSGKTLMMAELVRRVSTKTVITAPTEPIAQQTYSKLVELFGPNDWSGADDCSYDFMLLTGGARRQVTRKKHREIIRATVFVATVATAAGMPKSWWSDVECLMVDERHHQAAKTYRALNDLAANAYWRWGFTGTDFRSNPGEQVALEACLGRTAARFTIGEMIDRGVLVRGRVEWWPISPADCPGVVSAKFIDGYPRGVVDSVVRNQMTVYAATHYQRQGRKVLVLVQRIEHGERLQAMIAGSRFVKGADGDEVRKAVQQLDSGEIRCLIGSPVVGEGLDCPSADCLIYPKGYKARVTHTQDTFRVLTATGTKKDAVIVDFADRHSRKLLEHTIERSRNYAGMGMRQEVFPSLPVDISQLGLHK